MAQPIISIAADVVVAVAAVVSLPIIAFQAWQASRAHLENVMHDAVNSHIPDTSVVIDLLAKKRHNERYAVDDLKRIGELAARYEQYARVIALSKRLGERERFKQSIAEFSAELDALVEIVDGAVLSAHQHLEDARSDLAKMVEKYFRTWGASDEEIDACTKSIRTRNTAEYRRLIDIIYTRYQLSKGKSAAEIATQEETKFKDDQEMYNKYTAAGGDIQHLIVAELITDELQRAKPRLARISTWLKDEK